MGGRNSRYIGKANKVGYHAENAETHLAAGPVAHRSSKSCAEGPRHTPYVDTSWFTHPASRSLTTQSFSILQL